MTPTFRLCNGNDLSFPVLRVKVRGQGQILKFKVKGRNAVGKAVGQCALFSIERSFLVVKVTAK